MSTPRFHYCERSLTMDVSLPFISATEEEGRAVTLGLHEKVAPPHGQEQERKGRRAGVSVPKADSGTLNTGFQRLDFILRVTTAQ